MSDPTTLSILAAYQCDVICVACFSLRIPRAILTMARLGCLNVHPSLLPANRGPVPLFWTFRHACQQTGVTIHFMDEGMDTGDILAQEVIDVLEGISYTQLELQSAMQGGKLLARTVWELYAGRANPVKQDEAKSSYYSFPDEQDYLVSVSQWSAKYVYNFICGIAQAYRPVKLQVGKEYFLVSQATSYSQKTMCSTPDTTYCWRDEELWIRCKEGWLGVINPTIRQ